MTDSIDIKYFTDEAGNKSKVLISYEDWQRIEAGFKKWEAYEAQKKEKQPKLKKDEIKKLARKLDEQRAGQPKPSPEELDAKILKVNASIEPNNITMDEIVEECRQVRKERYERAQSNS